MKDGIKERIEMNKLRKKEKNTYEKEKKHIKNERYKEKVEMNKLRKKKLKNTNKA